MVLMSTLALGQQVTKVPASKSSIKVEKVGNTFKATSVKTEKTKKDRKVPILPLTTSMSGRE